MLCFYKDFIIRRMSDYLYLLRQSVMMMYGATMPTLTIRPTEAPINMSLTCPLAMRQ